MGLNRQGSSDVFDLQAEIEDLKARLCMAEAENRRLRHQQGALFRLGELPTELRVLVWERVLPDRRVLRVAEVPTREDDYYEQNKTMFCSARPPALLHACRESRELALAHFKPFFEKGFQSKPPRPIYFRPKLDILFLDFIEGYGTIHLEYPEVNEVESIAIPTRPFKNIWTTSQYLSAPTEYRFLGMTRLFLVTALERPWQTNRCCATTEVFSDAASKQLEIEWTVGITKARRFDPNVPNVQQVEAVIGKLVHHESYLDC